MINWTLTWPLYRFTVNRTWCSVKTRRARDKEAKQRLVSCSESGFRPVQISSGVIVLSTQVQHGGRIKKQKDHKQTTSCATGTEPVSESSHPMRAQDVNDVHPTHRASGEASDRRRRPSECVKTQRNARCRPLTACSNTEPCSNSGLNAPPV